MEATKKFSWIKTSLISIVIVAIYTICANLQGKNANIVTLPFKVAGLILAIYIGKRFRGNNKKIVGYGLLWGLLFGLVYISYCWFVIKQFPHIAHYSLDLVKMKIY